MTMKHQRLLILLIFFLMGLFVACSSVPVLTTKAPAEANQFRIWWTQGFLPEETEAIQRIVAEWQKKTGQKAELTLFANDVLFKETGSAIEKGNAPDVLFGFTFDYNLLYRLAWENKLEDVSDVIEPIKKIYLPSALQAVSYLNKTTQERSYYAVPFAQQTTHIHYWRHFLEEAGFTNNDIPTNWDDFWRFWEGTQAPLREKGEKDIYGVGFTVSPVATDSYFGFEHFLEAHNAQIVDENGQLHVREPQVRQAIIAALKDVIRPYQAGKSPPDATAWTDPDNNIAFLNSNVVMVVNPSLSIPATQREDPEVYNDQIVTVGWPNKPDGSEMKYLSSMKQAVILASSKHKKEAKDFLSYLVQPEVLKNFLESAHGRFFPVMPELLKQPFWNDPNDPHIFVATKQFQKARQFYTVFNPAYGEVQSQNVWGKALKSILKDGLSPQQAADQAIEEIEKIFADWK